VPDLPYSHVAGNYKLIREDVKGLSCSKIPLLTNLNSIAIIFMSCCWLFSSLFKIFIAEFESKAYKFDPISVFSEEYIDFLLNSQKIICFSNFSIGFRVILLDFACR
jgi:hypothetical protein